MRVPKALLLLPVFLLGGPASAADMGASAGRDEVVVRSPRARAAVTSVVDDAYVRSTGCPRNPDCIAPRVADIDHSRTVIYRAVPAPVDRRFLWKYERE